MSPLWLIGRRVCTWVDVYTFGTVSGVCTLASGPSVNITVAPCDRIPLTTRFLPQRVSNPVVLSSLMRRSARANPVILIKIKQRSPRGFAGRVTSAPRLKRPPTERWKTGWWRREGETEKDEKNEGRVDGNLWPVFLSSPKQASSNHTLAGIPAAAKNRYFMSCF